MAYDAFISYSHAADGELAPALQSGLQKLAKRWYRPRALRVFLDETGLSTNPHLWTSITEALDESEWFVLLASPEAATSEWVDREIEHWLATKPANRILPVATHGNWEWDATTNRLTGDAVPARLAAVITEEPRHLDLRWANGATGLDLRNSSFRSNVADLAAPIHGIAKDELVGEDLKQHRRARRLARAGIATVVVLLIVSIIFGAFAVNQRDRAQTATTAARQQLLVTQSQANLASDRQLATLLAIEADRRAPSADTRDAVLNAALAEPQLQRAFADGAPQMGVLTDHRIVVMRRNRGTRPNRAIVQVWDWETGRRQPWPAAPRGDANHGPVGLATTTAGDLLAIATRDGAIQMYSGRTLEPHGAPFPSGLGSLPPPSASLAAMGFSADGRSLAVSDSSLRAGSGTHPTVAVFSRPRDRWVPNPAPSGHRAAVFAQDLSEDGGVIATASLTTDGAASPGSDVVVSETRTGQTLTTIHTIASSGIALDWPRRRIVMSTLPGNVGDAVWYDLQSANPTPQVISRDLGTNGFATVGYDRGHRYLGVRGSEGFGIFDANTLAPRDDTPIVRPNTQTGPFAFVAADDVLLASAIVGPISLWDLAGTSVVATRNPPEYNRGLQPTDDPDRFLGLSTLGTDTTVSILGPRYRPLGPAIPIDQDLPGLATSVQSAARSVVPVACVDPGTHRVATIALASGDLVVRDGTSPFRELSRAPGITAHLAYPSLCRWRPDGRQIAIGTFAQAGQTRPTSFALYDVASKTLRLNQAITGELGVAAVHFSTDSKTLWFAGPNSGPNGVYEVGDLDHEPRIRVAFPGATGIAAAAGGRQLILAYPDSVRMFDARTRKPIGPAFETRGFYIYAVYSSPRGRLAVISSNQAWRLVDFDHQRSIGPNLAAGALTVAVLGASGTTVYPVGPNDGKFRWNLAPGHVRTVACGLAGRNLTAQEWERYLAWTGPRHATCPQYPLN